MPQNYAFAANQASAFRAFTDPNDLYQAARDFLTTPLSSVLSFLAPLEWAPRWASTIASVAPRYHKTFHRCVNSTLRSFHPNVQRQLYAVPMIASALTAAKTDKSDLDILPPIVSPTQTYCYYASIAETFGSATVLSDIAGGNIVLLALRRTTWTGKNRGLGAYDDTFVVIKGKEANRSATAFDANTEPSAQYSIFADKNDKKHYNAVFKDVKFNKVDGAKVKAIGDGFLYPGRLTEGTYQYKEKSHGHLGARAFIMGVVPTTHRDTNGDGYFDTSDLSRVDLEGAGVTMYIHCGNDNNTDSSGCQTIPKKVYAKFLKLIPENTKFYYVLVDVR